MSSDVLYFCVDGYSWIYRSTRKYHSHFPPSVNVYESTLARLQVEVLGKSFAFSLQSTLPLTQ